MQPAKQPLTLRALNAYRTLRGKSPVVEKEFVQPLSPLDGWSLNGTGRMHQFTTAPEQLAANLGWVFAANKAIGDPCAAVQPKLYFKRKDGEREEIKEHEILELLEGPNLVHTGEQLRQLHYTYMNLTGESYILMLQGHGEYTPTKGKLPDALQILPTHRVQFKLKDRFSQSTIKVDQEEYSIMNVIRDFNPDPGNPYYGRSIIAATAPALDLETNMMEWNRRFFANNAQTSMVVSIPNGLEQDARERLRQEIEGAHTGAENAFKPWIVEGESNVTQIGIKQNELQFLGTREFSMKEILSMFQVSPGLLGQVDDVNRSTLEAMFYQHAVQNVVPRVRQFTNQLNQTLVRVYDPRLELDFENPVPGDVEQKLKEIKEAVNVWITADEARAAYEMEPLPDGLGSHIIIPGKTPMTLDDVINGEAPDKESGQDPVDPDDNNDDDLDEDPSNNDPEASKALPAQPVITTWHYKESEQPSPDKLTMIDAGNEPELVVTPTASRVLTAPAEGASQVKKDQPKPQPELTVPTPDPEQLAQDRAERGDAKIELYRQRAEVYEQAMMTALHQQFEMQRSEILTRAQAGELHKSMGAATSRTKANQHKRDWLAALLPWAAYNDSMRKALAPILYALIVETGGQAMQQVGMDPSQFNVTDLDVLNYTQDRASRIAQDVNAETEKQLRASLGQGIDQGESDDQLRARVETVLGIALTTRVARVARTETSRAQGFADIAAWRQSGVVTGKEWLVQSTNPCPFCNSLDGVIVGLNQNFASLGDVITADGKTLSINYDDVPSQPVHPNCQCTLIPITVSL